jgi:hypothetical protein
MRAALIYAQSGMQSHELMRHALLAFPFFLIVAACGSNVTQLGVASDGGQDSPGASIDGSDAPGSASDGGDDGPTVSVDSRGPDATRGFEAGGACSYSDTKGTAIIRSVMAAPAGENNCTADPVKVVFDFAPDNPDAGTPTNAVGFPPAPNTDRTFTIGDGENPPRACLASLGITVGATFPATRRDLTAGTCTPTIFELDNLDTQPCTAACL